MVIKEVLQNDRIDRILDAVRGHLGIEIAFVSRYLDDGIRELTHIRTELPVPHKPGFQEPVEESYCWHVLQGNIPELIQNAQELDFVKDLPITKALPVGAHLNVPLKLSNGDVYGSFCCLSPQPNHTLTQRDMGILRSFATLAVEHIESNLEDDLRHSKITDAVEGILESKNLTIMHQPIVALSDGRPMGVECLSRFPDAKSRGPDKWFDEAEEVGLSIGLEQLAIGMANMTLSHVPQNMYMSVNASPDTVINGQLEQLFADMTPDRFVLEITEHQAVEDFGALAEALDRIRPFARIAIDDVGAGYAGLRHIVDLQPNILKLDMSLTRDIHKDPARRALTAALVEFGREIGCQLVAEGIEVQEEWDVLRELNVDYGQGYFFSKPLPVVAAQQWLLGLRDGHQSSEAETARSSEVQSAPAQATPASESRPGAIMAAEELLKRA